MSALRAARRRASTCALASLTLAVAWLLAPAPVARADRPVLPPAEQVRVNVAIDQGRTYLLRTQGQDGAWSSRVGYAALPGLTLLECGVEPANPQVQAAAAYVRKHWADLNTTYDLALAILFLDKLGDPRDTRVIQTFALRLIAGQTTTGGWSYECPVLNQTAHMQLLDVLRKLHEKEALEALAPGPPEPTPVASPPPSGTPSPDKQAAQAARLPRSGWCIKMADNPPPGAADRQDKGAPRKSPGKVTIPPNLSVLPVLQPLPDLGEKDPLGKPDTPVTGKGTTDNSNTQFAVLALWAAQRHGVPMDRTLRLIVKRFRSGQGADGGWGYGYAKGGGGSTAAMTGAGLMALAIGHGLAASPQEKAVGRKEVKRDENILKGFRYLMKQIGEPVSRMNNVPIQNFYLLWVVERVGVIYNVPTIGTKDWYRWGAEILVANQGPLGSWPKGGGFPGDEEKLNTCLALLFLRGANLAADVTNRLPFSPEELINDVAVAPPPPAAAPPPPKPADGAPSPLGPDGGKAQTPPAVVVPPPAAPPPKEEPPMIFGGSPPPSVDTTGSLAQQGEMDEPKARRAGIILAVVLVGGVLVLLAGGGLVVFLLTRGKAEPQRRRQRGRDMDDDDGDDRPRRPPRARKRSRVRYEDDA